MVHDNKEKYFFKESSMTIPTTNNSEYSFRKQENSVAQPVSETIQRLVQRIVAEVRDLEESLRKKEEEIDNIREDRKQGRNPE